MLLLPDDTKFHSEQASGKADYFLHHWSGINRKQNKKLINWWVSTPFFNYNILTSPLVELVCFQENTCSFSAAKTLKEKMSVIKQIWKRHQRIKTILEQSLRSPQHVMRMFEDCHSSSRFIMGQLQQTCGRGFQFLVCSLTVGKFWIYRETKGEGVSGYILELRGELDQSIIPTLSCGDP